MTKTEWLERISTPAYKKCGHCKQIKSVDGFSRNKGKKDGRADRCKQCEYEYNQTPQRKEKRHICQARMRRTEGYKLAQKRYSQSDKGKARRREYDKWYQKTEKRVIWRHNYRHTSKTYKALKGAQDKRYRQRHRKEIGEHIKIWQQSPRGKLSQLIRQKRYNESPRGKLMCGIYANSGRRAMAVRNRYHRIQDEAGCHSGIETFYPAYRFLKALETAPVVEIKVEE